MPYYDFRCPSCDHGFEKNLLISERDRDDVDCPDCGQVGAVRLVSAPNIGSTGRGTGAPAGCPLPVPT